MRTQHQIASELHALVCPEDHIHDAAGCPTLDDLLAALHEQSRLTRAQVVAELKDWAKRWPMNKSVVLGCVQHVLFGLEYL